MFHKS